MIDGDLLEKAGKLCKAVHKKGLCPGTHGNMSYRDGGRIRITPTGRSMEYPAFVIIDDPLASSDAALHREFYRINPEVDWVIHIHGETVNDSLAMMSVAGHGTWLGFKFPIDVKKVGKVLEKEKFYGLPRDSGENAAVGS